MLNDFLENNMTKHKGYNFRGSKKAIQALPGYDKSLENAESYIEQYGEIYIMQFVLTVFIKDNQYILFVGTEDGYGGNTNATKTIFNTPEELYEELNYYYNLI